MDWFLYDNGLCHERVKSDDSRKMHKIHRKILAPEESVKLRGLHGGRGCVGSWVAWVGAGL